MTERPRPTMWIVRKGGADSTSGVPSYRGPTQTVVFADTPEMAKELGAQDLGCRPEEIEVHRYNG